MRISELVQFHENPAVIAWWERRLGGLLHWLTPFRRRAILAAAAVWVGFSKPMEQMTKNTLLPLPTDMLGLVLVSLVIFAFSWLCYRAAAGYAKLPAVVRKHPQITLHLVYWGVLALLWATAQHAGLWREVLVGVALLFPFLLWRYGYMLMAGQHGRIAGTRFSDHLLTIWPVYGGSNTPYGKGYGYLSRCEAKDAHELAVSQLAGLRLLLLAMAWQVALKLMAGLVYGPGNYVTEWAGFTLGITRLEELAMQGGDAPWLESWASIYCALVYEVLYHAARGHQVIAALRLFGFNVFRNTYKPLLAESIVEFWNRYYYYFKELLANFFFLPTFTRLGSRLKHWPRLRLLLAVFAAAFVGNMYYHYIQVEQHMVLGNLWEVLYSLRSRMFYCFMLALGIYLSMLREQNRAQQARLPGTAGRILRIAGVWTFFGIIFIWNTRDGAPFLTRVDFFLGLFGLA